MTDYLDYDEDLDEAAFARRRQAGQRRELRRVPPRDRPARPGARPHRLLACSTDRHNRDRVLDALNTWGHDTSDLENAADVAARERHARLRAERASWGGNWTGAYSEDPPF